MLRGGGLVTKSYPTLCDPMDCSLPVFSVHGIFQARILKWVAISFSSRSSWPSNQTWVSCIAGRLTTLISLYIFTRTLMWPVDLNSGLKIFRKPYCKQMCYHAGFVLNLRASSWFSITLKGLRIFEMVDKCWLQLQPLTRASACPLKLWSQALTSPFELWKS